MGKQFTKELNAYSESCERVVGGKLKGRLAAKANRPLSHFMGSYSVAMP